MSELFVVEKQRKKKKKQLNLMCMSSLMLAGASLATFHLPDTHSGWCADGYIVPNIHNNRFQLLNGNLLLAIMRNESTSQGRISFHIIKFWFRVFLFFKPVLGLAAYRILLKIDFESEKKTAIDYYTTTRPHFQINFVGDFYKNKVAK